jgi:dienelactone hydrolase
MTRMRLAALLLALAAVACSGSPSSPSSPQTSVTTSPIQAAGFSLQGDPASVQGGSWTYRAAIAGTTVDLQGILLKPSGAGPFPAVVISHGAGGNASGYSRTIAAEMVRWGIVGIAVNYTHAGGATVGAPGGASEPGASDANIIRAHTTFELLRTLGYVDMMRVAAHGHSMGAFVTAALIAAYPADFRAASHTAGGVRTGGTAGAAPSEAQVATIRTPYQLHHGDADPVVALAQDLRLSALLRERGVVHELHVYPGADHDDVPFNTTVLARVRAWYAAHGMF